MSRESTLFFKIEPTRGTGWQKHCAPMQIARMWSCLEFPRDGVPVALEVTKELHVPLDIFLSRKLGVDGQEEIAFGAIARGGVRVLDQEIIEGIGISEEQIEQITEDATRELERRERLYRGKRLPLKIEGQTVLLVDDGIASSSTIRAAVTALRQ